MLNQWWPKLKHVAPYTIKLFNSFCWWVLVYTPFRIFQISSVKSMACFWFETVSSTTRMKLFFSFFSASKRFLLRYGTAWLAALRRAVKLSSTVCGLTSCKIETIIRSIWKTYIQNVKLLRWKKFLGLRLQPFLHIKIEKIRKNVKGRSKIVEENSKILKLRSAVEALCVWVRFTLISVSSKWHFRHGNNFFWGRML